MNPLGDTGADSTRPFPAAASVRTRAFVDAALALLFLGLTAVRLRIHVSSPLPSEDLVRWLVAGFVEDAAVAGAVATLLLALAGPILPDRWIRRLFSAFAIGFLAAEVSWSEVVIFFGQIPRLDVLRTGMNTTFIRGAAEGPAFFALSLSCVLFSILLGLAARWAKSRDRAWSNVRRLFIVSATAAIAAVVVVVVPLPIHRRETARHPLLSLARIWMEGRASESTRTLTASVPRQPLAVRELAPAGRKYFDDGFPLAHRPQNRSVKAARLPEGVVPNFVFLLMEGIRAEEVGAYGGKPGGLTPNLDRLARDGIVIEQAYSAGMHTPDAELALWYGVSPIPYASLMVSSPTTRLTGLPEILRAAGWRSFLWIHNGDQTFYRRDRFYPPRGFQMVDGKDFPTSDCRTNWGYSDRALARRAARALDAASEPFAAMVLTVSNHHPFQLPADADSPFPGLSSQFQPYQVRMLQTIHYTDEAVGDFFRLAEARPWFSRTVFVIAGDHGLSVAPYGKSVSTLSGLTELRHRVPLIIYSPMLHSGRVSGAATQADLPETLLALAGVESARTGLGRDLLDPEQSDPLRRVVTWSSEGGLVTVRDEQRIYHASIPSDDLYGAGPVRLTEEILIDARSDPDRKRNIISLEPGVAESYRHFARLYLDIYPWLLLSGRSGLPEDLLTGRRGKARASAEDRNPAPIGSRTVPAVTDAIPSRR